MDILRSNSAYSNGVTLEGTDGDDVIIGGSGDDTIFGGAGNDTITSGAGNDYLAGESGADVFTFDAGDGHDTIADFEIGIDALEVFGVRIDSFADYEHYLTQDGHDVLISLNAHQSIRLLGTQLDDLIAGGNLITGSSAADMIAGTSGNDVINGLGGNDVINAGDGDDIINGGEGNDTLRGQTGIDTLVVSGNFADYTITDNGNGSFTMVDNAGTDGTDTLVSIEFVEYADGTQAFAVSETSGLFNLTEGNDVFMGTSGDDVINALGGNDVVNAGDGDDIINGGEGNDTLRGQTGIDTLVVSGNFADYTITDNGNGSFTMVDNVGTDGTDTLVSIEFVEYADGTQAFAVSDGGSLHGSAIHDTFVFTSAEDGVEVSAVGDDLSDLTVMQAGNDTLLSAAEYPEQPLLFEVFTVADIDAADYI